MEMRRKKSATVPSMHLVVQRRYIDDNGGIPAPKDIAIESMMRKYFWTASEVDVFTERYLEKPKNFGYITSYLESKVLHYSDIWIMHICWQLIVS